MGRRRIYGQRPDPRRNDSTARWLRDNDPELAVDDQAATVPEQLRCECGRMMQPGVDHTCTPQRAPKQYPWEVPAAQRR